MKSLEIINKIESKKVELGMNVELGLLDDIKKTSELFEANWKQSGVSLEKIISLKTELTNELRKSNDLLPKQLAFHKELKADLDNLMLKSKDLGIDLTNNTDVRVTKIRLNQVNEQLLLSRIKLFQEINTSLSKIVR